MRKCPGKDRTVLRGESQREGGSRIYDGGARNAISALGTEAQNPVTSADAEDIQQELQDAHATGDGEYNIWFYD
jgi:hypothetical protein